MHWRQDRNGHHFRIEARSVLVCGKHTADPQTISNCRVLPTDRNSIQKPRGASARSRCPARAFAVMPEISSCDISGITTKAPYEAARMDERHVRIEISDFVRRIFIHEAVPPCITRSAAPVWSSSGSGRSRGRCKARRSPARADARQA